MSVYVGETFRCLRSRQWPFQHAAHLFADSEEELHKFAESIGLKRAWFQNHPRLPHYDVTVNKRRLAVRRGAFSLTASQEVQHYQGRR